MAYPQSMNQFTFVGNLTQDPKLTPLDQGNQVGHLRVAVNTNAKGEEQTLFVDVTVWGRMAEVCEEYLSKGSKIFVTGSLWTDSWVGDDGKERFDLKVNADKVQFISTQGPQEEPETVTEEDSEVSDDDVPF